MATLKINFTKEAELANVATLNDIGALTFSERGVRVGIGNGANILYDGMSHENFLKSILLDTEPKTDLYEGRQYVNKTDGKLYVYYNNKWNELTPTTINNGGGGGDGTAIDTSKFLIKENIIAGEQVTVEYDATSNNVTINSYPTWVEEIPDINTLLAADKNRIFFIRNDWNQIG